MTVICRGVEFVFGNHDRQALVGARVFSLQVGEREQGAGLRQIPKEEKGVEENRGHRSIAAWHRHGFITAGMAEHRNSGAPVVAKLLTIWHINRRLVTTF